MPAARRRRLARAIPVAPFVVRDPLFGDIALTAEERAVLDSDIFQRQRGVKQLGTSMLVYPSAVQTRFVHALGNLQIVGDILEHALENSNLSVVTRFLDACGRWLRMTRRPQREVRHRVLQIARLTGMCHDLGHFPLGHVLEYAIQAAGIEAQVLGAKWKGHELKGIAVHEFATHRLIEDNGADGSAAFPKVLLRQQVLEVLEAPHRASKGLAVVPVTVALAELVASEVDSDRAEYLRRDNYVSGAGYGQYDLKRLLESFLITEPTPGEFRIRPSTRALPAVETFLLERVKSYMHLYYHNLGVLMDALTVRILKLAFGGEALASARGVRRKRTLAAALQSVTPADLNYRRFADPSGYVDDAFLWQYLRRILATVEVLDPRPTERELRRLRTYLRALLRRRHLWVALWKRAEDFSEASASAFEAFRHAAEGHQKMQIDRTVLRQWVARTFENATQYRAPDPGTLSILNLLAHAYEGRLESLGNQLEELLLGDKQLRRLRTDFFVEVGHRNFFKPLKRRPAYEVVGRDGRLKRFDVLAPAAARAIESVWYEGIQLRMFVLTDRELAAGQRDLVRSRARALLPTAIGNWLVATDIRLDLGEPGKPPARASRVRGSGATMSLGT